MAEAPAIVEASIPIRAPVTLLMFKDLDLEEFPPSDIQSKLLEVNLDQLQHEYQIPLEFRLEVPLPTDRASNPPPGRIALFEEYLQARV